MSNAERNLATAIEHVIVARPARLPADIHVLASAAILNAYPSRIASQCARIDHIAALIDTSLPRTKLISALISSSLTIG